MASPVTPLTPEQTAAQKTKASEEGYIHRNLAEDDVAIATLFDVPNGVTISSEAAILSVKGHGFKRLYGRALSAILNLFQKNHGAKAVASDEERAEAADKYLKSSGITSK